MELKSLCLVLVLSFMAITCYGGDLFPGDLEAENGGELFPGDLEAENEGELFLGDLEAENGGELFPDDLEAEWELVLKEMENPQSENLEKRGGDWAQIEGAKLTHVSRGRAGVWGVSADNYIYYREDTYLCEGTLGSSWTKISGSLKQVDVGYNVVWGVASNDYIYYRQGISTKAPKGSKWVRVTGALKHVSVSQKGHVWGVDANDDVYHRVGASNDNQVGKSWRLICGALKQISVGRSGVWGVNSENDIFYRQDTYGDPCSDPDGLTWIPVSGSLKYISSSDIIYGVDEANDIYFRVGVTAAKPVGTSWRKVTGKMKQIESLSLTVWGVNADDNVYTKDTD